MIDYKLCINTEHAVKQLLIRVCNFAHRIYADFLQPSRDTGAESPEIS